MTAMGEGLGGLTSREAEKPALIDSVHSDFREVWFEKIKRLRKS